MRNILTIHAVLFAVQTFLCGILFPLAAQPVFTPDCVRLGEANAGYFDGEILDNPPRMAFQDNSLSGTVWVARINPLTGLFETPSGRDQKVADNATGLITSANGPEWGVDANGPAVYFTKQNGTTNQIWRAALTSGTLTAVPLTSGITQRLSPMPRRAPSSLSTPLVFIQGSYGTGKIAWLDASDPTGTESVLTGVEKGVSGPRFIPGTADFVYATTDGQIAHYSTASNTSIVLTSDAGFKTDPFAYASPELGGKIAIVAIENQRNVVVYEPSTNGNSYVRRSTAAMPSSIDAQWHGFSAHPFIYSLEPFVFAGKSYFSLHAQRDSITPPKPTVSSVWLFSMDPVGSGILKRRLDDGSEAHRIDPEFLITPNDVFVYYNELPAPWKVYRCRTGLGSVPSSTSSSTLQKSNLSVFPNPFSSKIQLEYASGLENFQLLNAMGQTIWAGKNIEQQDFSQFQNGLYFLKVSTQVGQQTIKLIKQ